MWYFASVYVILYVMAQVKLDVGVLVCMHSVIYKLQVLVMCPASFGTFYSAVRIYSFVSPCFDIGIVIYERMVYGYVTIYVANLDVV